MASDYAALWMVGTLFALLLVGYPVALTLGGVALWFGLAFLDVDFLSLLPLRIWGVMTNGTLLAVPLFIFMGVQLEKSGLAEELLESMAALWGRLRGGHALAVIAAGALLAASTGIVGASVVTMGLISLPVLLKHGYPKRFAAGVICAAGTLGQIIPPSIVLVLLGDIVGVSVGELFLAAVVPGLLLVCGYASYALFVCRRNPPTNVELPSENDIHPARVLWSLISTGSLMVTVLGSIFFGIASPTEAAAVGAFGAMVLSLINRTLSARTVGEVSWTTMQLTSMVFLILLGATAFGLVF
ncbi:MAG: TRAP transporter large permease subunit, partial [Bdellovibrionales bacterium]|nr:TRAP transporter large permease subunit [Bdellovibrionales bacterium]